MDGDGPVAAPARLLSVTAASESSEGVSDQRNPQDGEKLFSVERAMLPTGAPEQSKEEDPRGEDPVEEDSDGDVAVAIQEDIAPLPKRRRR